MTQKKLLFFFCILLFVINSSAQGDKDKASPVATISAEELDKLPFSQGVNNFTVKQNFNFTRIKPEDSDNNTRTFGLSVDYNRFVIDGLAIGANIDFSSLRSEIGSIDVVKSTSFALYGNVIYGRTFESGFNLYGKASVGFGTQKTSSTSFATSKDDLFGYRFEIGAPIHLFKDGGNYITPFIRYNSLKQTDDEDDDEYTVNEFSLGFQFQNYSPWSAHKCDCNHGRGFSGGMYDQGRSFIGYTSMGEFGFGNTKFESGSFTDETDISGGSFNLEYGYYISKDIALGAGISWSSETEKDDAGKVSESAFSFMPMITLNAPAKNCLENLFLQGGYGFGSEKTEIGSTEYKYSTSNLNLSLGFNHFFGKHIALTPKIGYLGQTFKNKDTDVKDRQSGFQVGIGARLIW
jgi:hypothetical protein